MIEKAPQSVTYSSPHESAADGEVPQHRFDILIDGKCVGAAEVDYYSRPIPLYQITELYVDYEHKGKGYASRILDRVEHFLIEKRKPGILVDAIIPGDPAEGLYTRRGWTAVPNSNGIFVFNWPQKVPLSTLIGYASK